ncbi:cytochrome bd-I ubiquinol oxidase subunit 1 apoprotein [Tepidamorphus gemmatus]|uniref:Cytochrome bd-I ubiquinol oxidase subunit 1 apoprotein n=1 Tax=Tepidamorphus gemmatus TaxID=747076 RepID=A0A4R3MAD6_9HYPH|nr:cytochrome bd-I ubiquinol oxidase subunit 1 apoprotein [Tepidamorphus gemmatus]
MDVDMDAVMLARIQFAFTVSFHIIFPSLTIGLAAWIATLLVMWRRTGREHYYNLARFWTRIFAVSFAMGVVSGIVLSYQFGTNWSRFSDVVGNVVAPLIGYEVLTAFFLEATFLGIMLFGWNRLPPWLHVTAAICVAVGTTLSAFWILSANSWMQFPAGHVVRDGIAYPDDWLKIIFSPTFHWRFLHMLTAAYLTTCFVVIAVGARYLIAGKHREHALTMLRMGLGMAMVLAPLQAFFGDSSGQSVRVHQPAKLAAIEGHWDGDEPGPVPLILFAIPNEKEERNDFQIAVPYLGSIILTHSLDGTFPGLKQFAPEDRPPVWGPFFGFRVMVGIGVLMILVAWWGGYLWRRGRLGEVTLFTRVAALMWPTGFIAVLAGWLVTENGRQPWVATGILRTADAASPVSYTAVLTTLILFVVVYSVVFSFGIYYINRLINRGPVDAPPVGATGLPSRPITGMGRRPGSEIAEVEV